MGGEPEREAGAEEKVFEFKGAPGELPSFLVDGQDVLRGGPDGMMGVIPNAMRTECARWWPVDVPGPPTPGGGEAARELDGLCVIGAISNVGRTGHPPCREYVTLPGLLPLLLLGPLESCGVGTV